MELILRENNLYRNGFVIDFGGGEEALLRNPLILEGSIEDEYYTVRADDRIDIIAYDRYKNYVADSSKYWWVIADANTIINPLDLSKWVGKEILIPNILNVLLNTQ